MSDEQLTAVRRDATEETERATTAPDGTDATGSEQVIRYESDGASAIGGLGTRKRGIQMAFFDGQYPTGEAASLSVREQTTAALERLAAVAAEQNVDPADVLQTTVYLTDADAATAVRAAYDDFFDGRRPAMTVVGVDALPADADVQIDARGVKR